jgi:hypothetical protein
LPLEVRSARNSIPLQGTEPASVGEDQTAHFCFALAAADSSAKINAPPLASSSIHAAYDRCSTCQ